MIELRAHHLLCAVSYTGRGYSPQFEAAFADALQRIRAGEDIRIIEGPDVLCQSLESCGERHCLDEAITTRDRLALRDLAKVLGQPLNPGDSIRPKELYSEALRQAFKDNRVRSACAGCQWKRLCNSVAKADFGSSILFGAKGEG